MGAVAQLRLKIREFQSSKYSLSLTILIGVLGVVFAQLLGLPIPFLLGPIIFVGALSFFESLDSTVNYPFYRFSFIILGVYLGYTFEASIFERIETVVIVTIFLVIFILLSIFIISYYLVRIARFSWFEALFATLPGLLSVIASYLSLEYKNKDQKAIIFIHTVRVVVIVSLLPLVFKFLSLDEVSIVSSVNIISLSYWLDNFFLFSLAIVFAHFFQLFKVPNGGFVGATIVAATLKYLDILEHAPPDFILSIILLSIGISIGCRFGNLSLKLIFSLVKHGMVAVIISFLIIIVLSLIAKELFGLDYLFMLLNLTPGGNHEVAIIALNFDIDPIFVTFIHWLRVVIIILLLPQIPKLARKLSEVFKTG